MSEEKKLVKVKLVKHEWPDERRKRHQRYYKTAALFGLAVGLFFSGIFVGSTVFSSNGDPISAKLYAAYRIMNEKWYFGSQKENLEDELIDDAISGLTSQSEDMFTSYMDAQTAKKFMGSMEGNMVGVGVQYSTATDDYIVLKVFKDSAADNAGIKAGDIIRKVDGVSVKEIENITEAVTGKEGTQVVLTVQRGQEMIDVTCTRKGFDSSVNGYIKDGVGVLEILTIADNTAVKVGEILSYFESEKVSRIIIDVRDNGGGYLTSIVDIASYFLPKDSVVLQEKDKNGTMIADKTNSSITPYKFDKIVVLMNGDTASAAEVLAIALKENLNVTLVGDQTYGKGTIQTTLPFKDGSMLKYTKAIWLSPHGNWINEVGVTPDIEVKTPVALLTGKPTNFEEVGVDSVSAACMSMQMYLDYLGYEVGRVDGYFSTQTLNALHKFQNDYHLEKQDTLDEDLLTVIFSKVIYESRLNESLDIQKIRAFEEVKK